MSILFQEVDDQCVIYITYWMRALDDRMIIDFSF